MPPEIRRLRIPQKSKWKRSGAGKRRLFPGTSDAADAADVYQMYFLYCHFKLCVAISNFMTVAYADFSLPLP